MLLLYCLVQSLIQSDNEGKNIFIILPLSSIPQLILN